MSAIGNFIVELWDLVIWQLLLGSVWNVVYLLGSVVLRWAVPIAWFVWWLFGVDWRKVWPVLRQGAWIVVAVLAITGAMVWAQLSPSTLGLGAVNVPNFWWQLGAVGALVGLTLCCGVLQGARGWAPTEIALEPAESGHDDHAHQH